MTATNISGNKFSLSTLKWLGLAGVALIVVIMAIMIYQATVLSVGNNFTVKPHAYGRPGHAENEATIRLQVGHVTEWWYNPRRPQNNDLYVGLAGTGPTMLIFYNSTYNSINTAYYEPDMALARQQAHKQGYTVLVAIAPLP